MLNRSQRRWAYVLAAVLAIGTPLLALAQEASAPSPAPEPPRKEGRLHLVFFGSETNVPVAGVRVDVGSISSVTNENGAVELVLPEGSHAPVITTRLADGGEASHALPPVAVAAGEVSQVIATLAPDGTIASVDVEAPGTDESPESAEPVQAASAGPVGTVRGTVKSLEGNEPVAGARIYVRGSPVEGETDAQGKFTLELPEGEHALSIIHASFSTQTLDVVQVRAADTTELVVEMTPAGMALDDFVVTAPHIQGSVASLLDTRRESAAATDSIGAEDIKRTPASDAAGAAQRVVGATIVDGRFIYVRGLGERYTNARLNFAPLPSPEPDRASVPLDLFPAQIIERLEISKTFTPDMPADFAGGSVHIQTIRTPDEPVFQLSLGTGYNSQSTFRAYDTYEGGRWDWLGIDDGTRALADEIPRDTLLNQGQMRADGTRLSGRDLDALAPYLNSPMHTKRAIAPPNTNGSLLAGYSWRLGKDVKLGVVASLTYSRRFTAERRIVRNLWPGEQPGELTVWNDYRLRRAEELIRWGAFSTVSLDITEDHQITLTGFRTQLTDNWVDLYDGFSSAGTNYFSNSRLSFAARALAVGQLQGEHRFRPLDEAKLRWDVSLARATRDEPDTRDVVYRADPNVMPRRYVFNDTGDSGRHFFSGQFEDSYGGGVDWTQPIKRLFHDTKLKFGGRLGLKDRSFAARRFHFNAPSGGGNSVPEEFVCGETYNPRECPIRVFTEENVTGRPLRLIERTASRGDAYEAGLQVWAGYGMVDAAFTEKWRAIGGARVEITHQYVQIMNQFSGQPNPDLRWNLDSTDVLPAGALVYSPREDTNLRLAVSRTIARPQLRELTPFEWADFWGAFPQAGNPQLKLTHITNEDVRVEFFPTPREVLALSVFAKQFQDPIEQVAEPTSGGIPRLNYQNARGATLYGFEIEARKELGFIAEALENFSVTANLTVAQSKIRIVQPGDAENSGNYLTNSNRPMVQQAPYVVNLGLDYETESGTMLRLLYNLVGPRIVQVGMAGLDDAYLHPIHLLDFVATQALGEHFQLRFTVANLLNTRIVLTQGRQLSEERILNAYREGITASLSLTARL